MTALLYKHISTVHHGCIAVHSTTVLILLRSQPFASCRIGSYFIKPYWNKAFVFRIFRIIPQAQIYQMYTKGYLGNLYMHLWDKPISPPRSPTSPSKPDLRRSSSVAFNALMRVRDLALQMLLYTPSTLERMHMHPLISTPNFKNAHNPDASIWLRHNTTLKQNNGLGPENPPVAAEASSAELCGVRTTRRNFHRICQVLGAKFTEENLPRRFWGTFGVFR